MRLQLDTVAKTIKIEDDVNLNDLLALVKKLLPDNEWRKYSLSANVTIKSWSDPIIIHDHYYWPRLEPIRIDPGITHPYEITCGNKSWSSATGVFNLDVRASQEVVN